MRSAAILSPTPVRNFRPAASFQRARADPSRLNDAERDLRRYMQVILPPGESTNKYLKVIRAWPSVEEAHAGPEVSLPQPFKG